uniref:Relish n=1 Tax=Glossina morsitans morsitans TaxID=37546 RepID=Q2XW28_GLOMM|nr:relish [Glossina morsitans morsitans]ABF47913.1 relish [Glossina morsitans morsitans]
MINEYYVEKDIVDMDTMERVPYRSESSNTSTSGYSTGPWNSPASGYSPAQSPASALPAEFSTLNVVSSHSMSHYEQQQPMAFTQPYNTQSQFGQMSHAGNGNHGGDFNDKMKYEARLEITEEPMEKFRFRYISEMHGTHGSLNGANSQRNPKTFPEVRLVDYRGPAIIRCSLFQANLESPHSHQLVIRKDDDDVCDPHDVKVGELGYYAKFANMGIIHTAKKFIMGELLKKKRRRLILELGGRELTTKEEQEIHKQTEKEAKDMNLNQVRLCYEAFRVEENGTYVPIAAPVYSRLINNRKSAQTGDLRITRLSICTGSVLGNEDLILLVEKVSKKNIKVRFYEMNDDDGEIWEAFAQFRESDVHHQYAIVCKTPPYKDRDIDRSVEVFIELVRPSDDERSFPPVTFRYKPRDAVISRKRKRTCSTTSSRSNSNISSGDLPKTVHEQSKILTSAEMMEELERLLQDNDLKKKLSSYSDDMNLSDLIHTLDGGGRLERDGSGGGDGERSEIMHYKKKSIEKKTMDNYSHAPDINQPTTGTLSPYLQRISKIYVDVRNEKPIANETVKHSAAEQITKIFNEHLDNSDNGDSIMHEVVLADNNKSAMQLCHILTYFKIQDLLNTLLNSNGQTALHYACLYNRAQYMRPLITLGCRANLQDNQGNTSIHIAVREKYLKCLESFINANIILQLNILNDDGFTPLHLAIRDNNYEMAIKMLRHDRTIAAVANNKDGGNALHMVVQQQHLPLVEIILETQNKVSILKAQNAAGYTPYDLAKELSIGSKSGQQILSALQNHYTDDEMSVVTNAIKEMVNEREEEYDRKLVIKEEEATSSSTDDEDEENDDEPMLQTSEIKIEESLDKCTLKIALNNANTFQKLSLIMNKADKWKLLAQILDIEYDFFESAEGVLNWLKRHLDDIDLQLFSLALDELDKTLLDIIRTSS